MSGTDSLATPASACFLAPSALSTARAAARRTRPALAARRAASRAAAPAFALECGDHSAALVQLVDARHDHRVARLQSGCDLGYIAFHHPFGDGAHGDGIIRLQQPHVGPL